MSEMSKEMETKKEKKKGRIGPVKMFAWQSRAVSTAIQVVMIGSYLPIYCTNALGMNAALVGTLLMACKIFDGFTDLVAGYIVDNTNTRWGKGRPYEWCIIGLWLCTWLCFSVPEKFSLVGQCVWICVFYTLAMSIFYTFLGANGTVYMIRAFNDDEAYIKLSSIGGLIVTGCVIIYNMIWPALEAKVLTSPSGWSSLVFSFAWPLALIGILRFFLVKETENVDAVSGEKVTFNDVKTLLKTNKYVYIVAALLFVSNIIGNMSVAQYYFLYIVNNLEISGSMQLVAIAVMPIMLLFPVLLKKMSIVQLIQRSLLLYLVSATISWFAKDRLLLLGVAGLFAGAAALPMSYLSGLLLVDCANYNEWIGNPRMEGTLGCVTGFATKVGGAFGTFLLGILLTLAGFNGKAAVQTDSALLMIRFIYCILPAIFAVIMALILKLWKLDEIKPQMESEIAERRAAAMAAVSADNVQEAEADLVNAVVEEVREEGGKEHE